VTERVIKIGGAALADASWLASFADAVAAAGSPLVIVHGGGPEITTLSERLAVETRWHEGRRVTPPVAMDVATMVLNGLVNTRVTAALLAAGVDAVGLSGVGGGLLAADLLEGGLLGRVGVVRSVRTGMLTSLLQAGHTVVVSPVSLCGDGDPVNVNADDAASAIAAALGAAELVFLTDVPGVQGTSGLCARLDAGDALGMVRSGVAFGGMGVKLAASVQALGAGVPSIRIGDARVLYDGSAGTVVRRALHGVA
jgi:acetylglutamate kinase